MTGRSSPWRALQKPNLEGEKALSGSARFASREKRETTKPPTPTGIAIVVCVICACACSTFGSTRRGTPGVGDSGEHVTTSPAELDLEVVVRPRLGADPHLELDVEARSDELPRRWVVQKGWAGESSVLSRIHDVHAKCEGRDVPLVREDLETHVGWTFADRCTSTTFRY